MKVRIGIANTDKLMEIEVSDEEAFKADMEKAVDEKGLGWFTDSKGRTVGIPAKNIAFILMDDSDDGPTVGFAPAG